MTCPWQILKIHSDQFTRIISVCSLTECLSSVCGFPLSQYLRDQSWFCGRNARMSACLVSLNNTAKNVHRRFFTTQTCNPRTVTGFVRGGSVCNKSICNEVNQVVLRNVFSNTVSSFQEILNTLLFFYKNRHLKEFHSAKG